MRLCAINAGLDAKEQAERRAAAEAAAMAELNKH
jgi:hypothetical protein